MKPTASRLQFEPSRRNAAPLALCGLLVVGSLTNTGCSGGSTDDLGSSLGSTDGGAKDEAAPDAGPAAVEDAMAAAECPDLKSTNVSSDEAQISADTHWPAARYVLTGSLSISGGVLDIDPCSVVAMAAGSTITVRSGGALKAVGTATQPIRFTSAKASGAAGDWKGIELYAEAESASNRFSYAVVEYAGSDSYGAIWLERGASASISHTTVQRASGVGIYAEDGAHLRDFADNTLTNNAKGALRLGANGVDELGEGTYSPNSVDGILIASETVDHDAVWLPHDAPYIAENGFSAGNTAGSANLVLRAGTVLKLGPGASISIRENAGLALAGTAAAPVKLTSSKRTPSAGDWTEIDIYSASADAHNRFEHAILEYGGSNTSYGTVWLDRGAGLSMSSSEVTHSGAYGLYVSDGAKLSDFADNTLTGNANGALYIGANTVDALGTGTYSPNTVNAIVVAAESVDHDATWLAHDAPYVLPNGFSLDAPSGSAHLTVAAGTTFKLGDHASIAVRQNAGLTLAGTADKHVTLTCAKATCAAGDWTEIDIYGSSVDAQNVFSYTDVSFGGSTGTYGQLWIDSGAAVTLNNTTFASGQVCDVYQSGADSLITAQGTNAYALCVR
jgi:hypothetical protein